MKVLVVGGGGRESAIAWKLHSDGHEVVAVPGSDGMRAWARCHSGDPLTVAQQESVDLTIVGPEQPLAEGIVDSFQASGLAIFGPTQRAAQLESSKAFSKRFMEKYGVPTARCHVCTTAAEGKNAIAELFSDGIVLKASGLAAGKGVVVCDTREQAEEALERILIRKEFGETELVVEERMHGPEVSLFCFSDGKKLVPMLPAQDHKRLLDGDEGPNTGGMGAFAPSSLGFDASEVLLRTQEGLEAEELDYRGIVYIGLMLTEAGPKVLEYNCRFGDPETQVVLPLLASDLAECCLACVNGDLVREQVRWNEGAAATVVLAAPGYPQAPERGLLVTGIEGCDGLLFHAGTRRLNDQWLTNGGRVVNVVGLGEALSEALSQAYGRVEAIHFDRMQYRKDIGSLCRAAL